MQKKIKIFQIFFFSPILTCIPRFSLLPPRLSKTYTESYRSAEWMCRLMQLEFYNKYASIFIIAGLLGEYNGFKILFTQTGRNSGKVSE